MKYTFTAALLAAGIIVASASSAAGSAFSASHIRIEVTNLTNAIYFTPILVATHDSETHLFRVGTEASDDLEALAEGGNFSGLITELENAGGDYVPDPAGGLLAPGASTTAALPGRGPWNSHLSVVAMMLPSNDGFVGADSLKIPNRAGTYVFYLSGYDAGTETNDERIVDGGGTPDTPGIPADPGGNGGENGTGVFVPDHNAAVHVHRGTLGDLDDAGGISDLDTRIHKWHNPIAKLVVRVGRR